MTDANARAERLSLVRARRVAGPALRAGLGILFNTSLEEDLATHVRLRLAALAGTTQATYYSDLTRMFTFAVDNGLMVNWSSPAAVCCPATLGVAMQHTPTRRMATRTLERIISSFLHPGRDGLTRSLARCEEGT